MEGYVKTISKCYLWGVDLLMILVTLGTQDKGFERLLKAVDKQIEKGIITDKVIVQAGYTSYQSDRMEIFDMISKEELEQLTKKADLIITHGGVGSILTALSYDKKVIAVPRLSKYKEHTNDHQKQIVSEFANQGYILAAKDISTLGKMIEKSKTFKPKKYQSNRHNFIKLVDDYITSTNHISWYNRDKKVIGLSIVNLIGFMLLMMLPIHPVLASTIIYLMTSLLMYLWKPKVLSNSLILFVSFYALDILLLLLLYQQWHLSLLLTKIISNLSIILLYHLIDKRN